MRGRDGGRGGGGGMAPGSVLAAALARIDPARVPNNDLLALLVAQHRQASHEATRLLGVIAEINRGADVRRHRRRPARPARRRRG